MTIPKMKKINWLLIFILLVAFFLRAWKLNVNPPSLSPDEASLGYNAYSILRTGKDEYGKLLPVIFKSFGDYKPGLYIYLTTPFVAVLGLNEWSVRLPSAIAGVFAVYLIFLITKELLDYCSRADALKKGTRSPETRNKLISLTTSFLLAISPWHMQFGQGCLGSKCLIDPYLSRYILFFKIP